MENNIEGGLVLCHTAGCVHRRILKCFVATFGHSSVPDTVITRTVNRNVQTGKSRQLRKAASLIQENL